MCQSSVVTVSDVFRHENLPCSFRELSQVDPANLRGLFGDFALFFALHPLQYILLSKFLKGLLCDPDSPTNAKPALGLVSRLLLGDRCDAHPVHVVAGKLVTDSASCVSQMIDRLCSLGA